MPIQVPDEFRQEVLDRGTTGIEDLRQSARTHANVAELRDVMRREGWSPAFIDWYASRAELTGIEVDLVVPIRGSYEDEMRNYERAVKTKRAKFRSGLGIVILAWLAAIVCAALQQNSPVESSAAMAGLIGSLVAVGLWFVGLAKVAESKGQSRWWALLGLSTLFGFCVFLLQDRNVPRIPSKTGNHEKPEGAVLSDW